MLDRVKWPLTGCLACAAGLVVVRLLAFRTDAFGRIDAEVVAELAHRRWASTRGAVAAVIVHIGDPLVVLMLLVLICALAIGLGRPRQAVAAAVLVAGASLTTQALKATISHARYQAVLDYEWVGATAFPSGHTTAVASLAFALALVVPRRRRPAAIVGGACAVAAVGSSVVIRHWHFPSDVIGGVLVAVGWGFAVVAGMRVSEQVDLGQPGEPVP